MNFLSESDRSNVFVIEFQALKDFKCFPTSQSHLELSTILIPIASIDLEEGILIFISHRGVSSSDGSSIPLPDTPGNDKFKLVVEAIDKILSALAPRIKNCYIWIDCVCSPSSSSTSIIVPPYDILFPIVDIILTPMFDGSITEPPKPNEKYEAKPWRHGPEAYLNRTWYLNSNIDLVSNYLTLDSLL